MPKFTYTIFDSNPARGGDCAWPSHHGMTVQGRLLERVEARVRRIARSAGRTCGAYRPEDRLWYLVWDEDGAIVADGSVTLGGPGLPACSWRATWT